MILHNLILKKLLPLVMPSSTLREKTKEYYHNKIQNYYEKQYHKHIVKLELEIKQRMQNPHAKLKIGFVVNERDKWNAQYLYDILRQHNRIECTLIYIKTTTKLNDARNLRFYQNICHDLVIYDNSSNKYTFLNNLQMDVVFLQQPSGKFLNHPRAYIYEKYLRAYFHYSFSLRGSGKSYYPKLFFFKTLWKYFCESEEQNKSYRSFCNLQNNQVYVVGYPKLDIYKDDFLKDFKTFWKMPDAGVKRVIYAPWHSFNPGLYGTFNNYARPMLEYAAASKNIQWLFSPHPYLYTMVTKLGYMNEREFQAYLDKWDMLPNAKVSYKGNYFDYFKTSDALITDGESFLGEYLPTGKPVIHLYKDVVPFKEIGQKIVSAYYSAKNFEDVKNLLADVVVNGNDTMVKARQAALKELVPSDASASKLIADYIFENFNLNNIA